MFFCLSYLLQVRMYSSIGMVSYILHSVLLWNTGWDCWLQHTFLSVFRPRTKILSEFIYMYASSLFYLWELHLISLLKMVKKDYTMLMCALLCDGSFDMIRTKRSPCAGDQLSDWDSFLNSLQCLILYSSSKSLQCCMPNDLCVYQDSENNILKSLQVFAVMHEPINLLD